MTRDSSRPNLIESHTFRTVVAVMAVVIACAPFLLEMISRWFG